MLFCPETRGPVSPALYCGLLAACAAGWPTLAWSQSPPPAAAPAIATPAPVAAPPAPPLPLTASGLATQAGRAPWDASAPVPPATYRSALSISPTAMPAPTAWAEANATVGRIGGWRAYLREVQGAAAAPSAGPANSTSTPTPKLLPAAPPAAASHGHHHGHGG